MTVIIAGCGSSKEANPIIAPPSGVPAPVFTPATPNVPTPVPTKKYVSQLMRMGSDGANPQKLWTLELYPYANDPKNLLSLMDIASNGGRVILMGGDSFQGDRINTLYRGITGSSTPTPIYKGVLSNPFYGVDISPDGTHLAIGEDTYQGYEYPISRKTFGICVVNTDSGASQKILEDASYVSTVSWSPNGKTIAFLSLLFTDGQSFSYDIFTINADGSDLKRVTTFSEYGNDGRGSVGSPSWSPNGEKIAFTVYTGKRSEIYTMQADGSNQQKIATGQTNAVNVGHGNIYWSHNASKLLFTTTSNNGTQIWAMNADGSNQTLLKDGVEPFHSLSNPRFLRDGKVSYVESYDSGNSIKSWVYQVDINTKTTTTLFETYGSTGCGYSPTLEVLQDGTIAVEQMVEQ
jgi:Domain of unknown function (DUF5050)/WD40-like Beta Propeller Repeat